MRLIFFILTLVFLVSCENTRTFDLQDFEKEVVLNGIISTDSIWNIQLSYTKSIFDDSEFDIIDEAEVKIVDLTNGQSFFLDPKITGKYSRQLHPVEGHDYVITASLPGREEIRAMTYVPSVLEVEVFSNLVTSTDGQQDIAINIQINDNPAEENFYVWELIPVNHEDFRKNNSVFVATQTEPVRPIDDNVNGEDPGSDDSNSQGNPGDENGSGVPAGYEDLGDYSGEVFNFELNTGESIETGENQKEFNAPTFFSENDVRGGKIYNRLILDSALISEIDSDYEIKESGEIEDEIPLFELKVMAVSSDLFEYLKTYEDYKRSEIKNTSISDPIMIHSNIENGLGIFGGYNLKSFYIY